MILPTAVNAIAHLLKRPAAEPKTHDRSEQRLGFRIPDASSATLLPIIEGKVVPDSIVYSDSWRGYNVLDVSDFHHFRINHSKLFADKQNHINGIENFWNQAKRHMRKFNGVPKTHFSLFLKECEWRFNNSDPSVQLSQLRQWVRTNMG
jgi:transposase